MALKSYKPDSGTIISEEQVERIDRYADDESDESIRDRCSSYADYTDAYFIAPFSAAWLDATGLRWESPEPGVVRIWVPANQETS